MERFKLTFNLNVGVAFKKLVGILRKETVLKLLWGEFLVW